MARTLHPDRTDHPGNEPAVPCRSVQGLIALTRLLAHQAAREFLEHADTADTPACSERVDHEAND